MSCWSSVSLCEHTGFGVGSALLLLPAQALRTSPPTHPTPFLLPGSTSSGGHVSGTMGVGCNPCGLALGFVPVHALCSRTCDMVLMNLACSHGFHFSGSP